MRVRPLLDTNDVACIQVSPHTNAILLDEGTSGSRNKFRRYAFDYVFDDKASQEMVYQKTTAALVKDVLNGFSAAVFAYGATGSGKNYFYYSRVSTLRLRVKKRGGKVDLIFKMFKI